MFMWSFGLLYRCVGSEGAAGSGFGWRLGIRSFWCSGHFCSDCAVVSFGLALASGIIAGLAARFSCGLLEKSLPLPLIVPWRVTATRRNSIV